MIFIQNTHTEKRNNSSEKSSAQRVTSYSQNNKNNNTHLASLLHISQNKSPLKQRNSTQINERSQSVKAEMIFSNQQQQYGLTNGISHHQRANSQKDQSNATKNSTPLYQHQSKLHSTTESSYQVPSRTDLSEDHHKHIYLIQSQGNIQQSQQNNQGFKPSKILKQYDQKIKQNREGQEKNQIGYLFTGKQSPPENSYQQIHVQARNSNSRGGLLNQANQTAQQNGQGQMQVGQTNNQRSKSPLVTGSDNNLNILEMKKAMSDVKLPMLSAQQLLNLKNLKTSNQQREQISSSTLRGRRTIQEGSQGFHMHTTDMSHNHLQDMTNNSQNSSINHNISSIQNTNGTKQQINNGAMQGKDNENHEQQLNSKSFQMTKSFLNPQNGVGEQQSKRTTQTSMYKQLQQQKYSNLRQDTNGKVANTVLKQSFQITLPIKQQMEKQVQKFTTEEKQANNEYIIGQQPISAQEYLPKNQSNPQNQNGLREGTILHPFSQQYQTTQNNNNNPKQNNSNFKISEKQFNSLHPQKQQEPIPLQFNPQTYQQLQQQQQQSLQYPQQNQTKETLLNTQIQSGYQNPKQNVVSASLDSNFKEVIKQNSIPLNSNQGDQQKSRCQTPNTQQKKQEINLQQKRPSNSLQQQISLNNQMIQEGINSQTNPSLSHLKNQNQAEQQKQQTENSSHLNKVQNKSGDATPERKVFNSAPIASNLVSQNNLNSVKPNSSSNANETKNSLNSEPSVQPAKQFSQESIFQNQQKQLPSKGSTPQPHQSNNQQERLSTPQRKVEYESEEKNHNSNKLQQNDLLEVKKRLDNHDELKQNNYFSENSNKQEAISKHGEAIKNNEQEVSKDNSDKLHRIRKFDYKTKAGCNYNGPKTNQDNFIIQTQLNNKPDRFIFAVCDGHGVNGHYCSAFLRRILPSNQIPLSYIKFKIEEALDREIDNIEEDFIENSLSLAFLQTSKELLESNIDCTFSGSTCVLLLIIGNKMWSANAGDSRSIMCSQIVGEKNGQSNWNCKPLSRDHKPDDPEEYLRIMSRGGRVETYRDENDNPVGPYRVWLRDENIPGLAMARSFGDVIASQVGVTCEPEIVSFEIGSQDRFIVLASDGVWEFIENEEVMDYVIPYFESNDLIGGCSRVVKASVASWKQNDEVIDDITSILVFLN